MAYFSPVQSQGIAFCSFDPQMTNCEFPAHCVNTSSGVSCVCSDGYIGDPPRCEGKCYWLGICQKNFFGHHVDVINLFYEISLTFYVPSNSFVPLKLLWFLRIFFQFRFLALWLFVMLLLISDKFLNVVH